MKNILFILLLISFTLNISAQKKVRSEIRSGNKAYKEQRYETAESHYQTAISENASSKEASYNLANTYYKQQRWDDALKEYQHYLTLENESPEKMSSAWSNMGNVFLKKKAGEKGQAQPTQQQGQQQQADNLQMSMEAYKNALRLNPADDETRYNLAVVQKMIQDQQGDGGGGGQDKNEDKKEDKKDEQKEEQQKQEQQEQQQNQMSQQNIEQILQAIEQDERDTQERVQKSKAEERKQKNQDNRRQNKDW